MGVTIVVSGPAFAQNQARAILEQAGFSIVDGDDSHGFESEPEESFMTARGEHPDRAATLDQIDWRLRSHWETGTEGQWSKGVGIRTSEESSEIARLRAQLRAAGIVLPED